MGMDTVELTMEIEEKYSLDIPDEDANRLITVQMLCDYIIDHAFEENEKDDKSGEVFDCISNILIDRFHVPKENIKLESKFVEDLDLD